MSEQSADLAMLVRSAAHPLTGRPGDYDPLLELIGSARFVLLGEASHGTHEFYREREQITRRLIVEKGFNAVALEADWPDAYRVNRYVRGLGDGPTAIAALEDFKRFPTWMWRNAEMLNFVGWLREHNDSIGDPARKVGIYGMDLYSLYRSIESVIGYLEQVDPQAARRARTRYACFDHFREDPQHYGYATTVGYQESCEDEVLSQLTELQRQAAALMQRDGFVAEDEFFFAEQNARVAKNAEQYYRSMFRGRVSSWNLRDSHMVETLDALVTHLQRHGSRAKLVIWAHNSHIGDARATEMGEAGEHNIGQLVRERYPRETTLIGFSTYSGSVSAASDWGADVEHKRVRPALPGSYEELLHQTGLPRLLLPLRGDGELVTALRQRRLERAIGVIYRPESERISHYFYARLPDQFDALIHIDQTRAVEPLELSASWQAGELPETFPTGDVPPIAGPFEREQAAGG